MKFFLITRQRLNTLLYYILCISLLLFASACGDADHSPSETGSISFSVEWRGTPTIKDASGSTVARVLDCFASGVATVEAEIYDENNNYLVSGGPWNCSAHAGTIENVPEGSNRKAVILGKDSSGAIVYQGEKTGISVTSGQATNAGVIQATSAIPTNVSATAGDGQMIISWDSVAWATSYKIYWATWSGVSKTSYEDTTNSGSSTNPDTTIFERVLSYNGHTYAATKNNMTWEEADTLSNQHGGYLVTINDAQENTFLADNYSSFISELWIGYNDKDNEDTWVWANGETSTYTSWATHEPNDVDGEDCAVIYESGVWNDVTCTNNSSYAIVEWGAATSYTHTGLTNGTTYYYVVTAINDYGESDESSEVSATPSAAGTAPSVPTNVAATAGDEQVLTSWDSVSDATSYNIYWSTSSGVTIGTGTKISNVTSPYTHTGRTNGATYYYVVTAVNSYGESDESNEVSAIPSGTDFKLPDTGQTQSFTSTFGEDSDYTINPPSYTDNGDGTITDNVTGLIWQKEDDNTTRIWAAILGECLFSMKRA